ncbi:MAG: 3'-5' exonuclease, partial [Chitinophagales bacterium]
NYRSTQEILDVAATTIKENKERLINQIEAVTLDKNLTASGAVAKENTVLPKIVSYPNASHETADIANQIIELNKQGVNLKEIGVLYSQHKQSEDIQQCLNQKNIPVSTRKKIDILSSRMTNMLLDILTYIAEENRIPHSREDLLFNMMLYPFFDIKAIQVARLGFELRENRYKNPKTTWREALANLEVIFDEKSLEEIKYIAELTNKWQKDLQELPLQLLFQTILDDVKCIEYITQHKEKVWLLQELKTFFDFIKQENQKNTNLSLSAFLEIITKYRDYGISIPFVKSTYSENSVQLTTIHGSKGLEYKHVFLMGMNSKLWESKRARSFGFSLPENIVQKVAKESKDEELRRLFFVAITRAEKYLQISHFTEDEKGKDLTPSVFLETLNGEKNVLFEDKKLTDDEVFDYSVLQLKREKISPELLEENMLKSRLENYKMSVTHLNNYLECPLKFYYQNFIQFPQAKNSFMAFGSAVHDAIELLFIQMLENEGKFPTLEEFVELGRRQMYKQQDSFSKKEYKQKITYIEKFYPEYYKKYVNEWKKEVKLEEKLEAVYEGINLIGKLDKIEFDKNNISVIDYKTGQWKAEKKKLFRAPTDSPKKPEEPSFEETYGGNYWRQAVFYKILIDNSNQLYQRDWILVNTAFDFVEPIAKTGEFHKEKVVINPNDVSIVKKQIKDTVQKINDLNFEGCG